VKGETLAKRSTIQTSQALQGVAAGVTVTSNSGKPGKEGTSIRIRGIGTINDNNPLVLIDGVSSSIDAVDPNDIESMSILKDAASASIYGSRAANGVILITTKRGKTDKVSVTFKGSVGITSPLAIPLNASAWDYMALYDEANGNDLRNDLGVAGGAIYGTDKITN
jgi:TonB-dependent SusC/RagA subfamily outer membrane receptor